MARDYKGRAAPKPKPKPQRSCVYWFVTGSLLGAFVVGLLWLQLDPALWRSGSGLDSKLVPRPKLEENSEPPSNIPIEFEFPQLLRDMQVLSQKEAPKPAVKTPPAKTVTSTTPTEKAPPTTVPAPSEAKERVAYVLQIGSFRKAEDAERLKAQLAFLGVVTNIHKVTIKDNETYHRVRAGPYRDQNALDQVRQLLTRNGINSIVVKWRG